MSTKNVPQVMEEIGEIVGSITRARLKRTVEQIVYNQVPQIQEQDCGRSGPDHPKSRCAGCTVMPSTDHPESSEDSKGSSSVVL